MASSLRNTYVSEAKNAEGYGNHPEMLRAMKKLVSFHTDLTEEERNLLRRAFKGEMRTLRLIEEDQKLETDKKVVHCEIAKVCDDMIALIDKHLLRSSSNVDSLVLYYLLKGDCYRYLAELKVGNKRKEVVNRSWVVYHKASKLAEAKLLACDYLRLAVALNMSVLMADMMDEKLKAIMHADEAYINVFALNMDDDDLSPESQSICGLLKENVAAWSKSV